MPPVLPPVPTSMALPGHNEASATRMEKARLNAGHANYGNKEARL